MLVYDINENSVKNISSKELVVMHYRVHLLYANSKKRKNKERMNYYKEKHDIIMNEMINRGIKHNTKL